MLGSYYNIAGLSLSPGSKEISETLGSVIISSSTALTTFRVFVSEEGGKLVFRTTREVARRSRSVASAVIASLNANKNFWLPFGVGAVFVGALGVGVAAVITARKVSGVGNVVVPVVSAATGKRHEIVGNAVREFDGLPLNPYDYMIDDSGLLSSASLVSELKLFTAFKVRDYTLLLQCVSRGAQLIRSLPDAYGFGTLDKTQRHRLLYGSVRKAFAVDGEELLASEGMKLDGAARLTKGWLVGRPASYGWREWFSGRVSTSVYLSGKLSSWYSSEACLPPKK